MPLVCETPLPAQDNAVTMPADISGQFLAGDQIDSNRLFLQWRSCPG